MPDSAGSPVGPIETRLHDLGGFIRDQRRNARLWLRKPSAEILQSIARGLRISAETLYVQAGILDESPGDGRVGTDPVGAIVADPTINDRQKQALIEIYRSFQAENVSRDAEAG